MSVAMSPIRIKRAEDKKTKPKEKAGVFHFLFTIPNTEGNTPWAPPACRYLVLLNMSKKTVKDVVTLVHAFQISVRTSPSTKISK